MFVADQRILQGAPATLAWQALDADGTPDTPAGTVTVAVATADGTEVLPAGTATSGSDADPRTVVIPAAQTAQLNWLTATWTDDNGNHTTTAEIVGGYYFTLVAALNIRGFDNIKKFEDADIIAARRQVEDDWERITNVALVPRYARETLSGNGTPSILLKPYVRRVRSVRAYYADGTYLATPDADIASIECEPSGVARARTGAPFPCGVGNLVVEYEHGYDRLPPDGQPLALRHMRYKLGAPTSAIPERADRWTATNGEWMAITKVTADSTGINDIDGFLEKHTMRTRPT